MMDPFGIAGDLGADHAIGIAVGGGAPHLADAVGRQPFHFQGAGARAIMGADGRNEGRIRHGSTFSRSLSNQTQSDANLVTCKLSHWAAFRQSALPHRAPPVITSLTEISNRGVDARRSEEHTSELQSHVNLVCR